MDLRFQVQAKIQKPVRVVFDAIYNPETLSAYFTTAGASGVPKEGTMVTWRFADFPGEFPIFVKKVIANELFVFEWEALGRFGERRGYNTHVEMSFESLDSASTLVRISESGWKETQEGLESSYGNCHGWTQMLCCLKAYIEYGITLRKGYF
jgi:uncharacterized protein YndB with AHSA1/START domain